MTDSIGFHWIRKAYETVHGLKSPDVVIANEREEAEWHVTNRGMKLHECQRSSSFDSRQPGTVVELVGVINYHDY